MAELPKDPVQLASLVAHQLKGPITAVSSLLQVMVGELAGPVTSKQRELIEKAISRCDESLEASQRLLMLSRALNQPEQFEGTCDLVKIVHDAVERYSEHARENRINIHTKISVARAIGNGTAEAISEVIEVLINNALKYTPDHGEIEIKLEYQEDSNKFCVCVTDSGIGVDPDKIEKIFEPFYRTVSARDSSRPGTGLGLSFVKTIAAAIGASVTVEGKSKLGGAKFTVCFDVIEVDKTVDGANGDQPEESFKVLIIGGVAAGPKVAAKIMRLMPGADVTIVEKGKLLSYAGCGLPYYIGGEVSNQDQLMSTPVGVVRDPVFFQKVKNIHIMNQTEALEIDRANKKVKVIDLVRKDESWLDYDKLVLATGSLPVVPQRPGLDLKNIFTLHGVSDAEGIKNALEKIRARDVVIVGGGLIGIEMTESLVNRGCRVTIVEKEHQILPMLDWEFSQYIEHHLESKGVRVMYDCEVKSFKGENGVVRSVKTKQGQVAADLVIVSAGIRPNVELAEKCGLEIGQTGAIKVDEYMQTSDEDIYAAGDCVETKGMLTGLSRYIPLGSTANKQGRIVAINICGGRDKFPGIMGTTACKIFDYSLAKTGLTEKGAKKIGYDVVTVLVPGPDREHFAPDPKLLMLKLVADKATGRLLGAQATGPGDAVKRIDIASIAIMNKMTVEQLANSDLCYSPPFSPVLDNIMTASNVVRNKLNGDMDGITPMELYEKLQANEDLQLLDVRTPGEFGKVRLRTARLIPLASLRSRVGELDKNKMTVTMCNVSLRGYEAAFILKNAGFKNVKVLDGGLDMWPYEKLY